MERPRARRLLRVAAGLAGVALLSLAALHGAAAGRLARRYPLDVPAVAISSSSDALARGRHLVEVVGQCTTCHGPDLSGLELADDPWLGRIWGPNLTPGRGGLAGRSDLDLVRAIRHGVKPDGRSVVMMPSHYFSRFDDRDLGAIVGFLRTLPPVDRVAPPLRVGPVSAAVLVSGQAPDLLPAELLAATGPTGGARPATPAATAAYGAYLVETGGCKVCHKADLAGGLHPLSLPEEPPPPDLTLGGRLAGWSEAGFVRALRTGRTPDGRQLDARWMPWPTTARMTDLELRAIWLHLRALPARGSARGV